MLKLEDLAIDSLLPTPASEASFDTVYALRRPEDALAFDGSTPPPAHRRIGEHLLACGAITPDGLVEALALQPGLPGRRLGWILVMLGRLEQQALDRVLAARLGVVSVSLRGLRTPVEHRQRIPAATAKRLGIALVHEDARTAWVAFADTTDPRAREAATFVLGKRIVALHAGRSEVLALLGERDPDRAELGSPYYDATQRRGEAAIDARLVPADSLDFVSCSAA
jgi:hypothetical protein